MSGHINKYYIWSVSASTEYISRRLLNPSRISGRPQHVSAPIINCDCHCQIAGDVANVAGWLVRRVCWARRSTKACNQVPVLWELVT